MNEYFRTNVYPAIVEKRKTDCEKLSTKWIEWAKGKGMVIDDYCEWFIKGVIERVLIGPKAYRMYFAHDPSCEDYDEARKDIKFGTTHHMFLKDTGKVHGMPTREWNSHRMSNGLTRLGTTNLVCDHLINNPMFLKYVKDVFKIKKPSYYK